jgi:tetratricopeptide (TPR) repeat protein
MRLKTFQTARTRRTPNKRARIGGMKILRILLFVIVLLASDLAAQPCLDKAKEIAPVLDAETREIYQEKLKAAEAVHLAKPNEADSIIWLGRRTAYLGRYKNAARQFSSGIVLFPNDARFYRHRGHRYITLRCFDDAIRDFEKAAQLIKGKPDEIEPDGLPNAKNTPTSTLQSNIWYHLGLAYYLKGDYKSALGAYEEAQKVSTNNDMRVATTYWHYISLRRSGNAKEAKKVLKPFAGEIELIENTDYLKLIKLYRNEAKVEDLLSAIGANAETLGSASLGYGVGTYLRYKRDKSGAMAIFRKIVAGNQWASFGYIAAEKELARQPR